MNPFKKDDIVILTKQGSFAQHDDVGFGAKDQVARVTRANEITFADGYETSIILLSPRAGQTKNSFYTSSDRLKKL